MRASSARRTEVEHDHLLHDPRTGIPTLAAALEGVRQEVVERGELVVLYFNFHRYSKLEELYGWEKLDEVLSTTATAMRTHLAETPLAAAMLAVPFTGDDDFVILHVPPAGTAATTEAELTELVADLQERVSAVIEAEHGEAVAALFDIFVGRSHVMVDPKVRLERSIYRGIREAVAAAMSVEARERASKITDLRESIRTRGVYIEFHPIVVATSGKIFGYEALARGVMRSMRSPEVMFEIAAQANLVWELSRLCRARAVEDMAHRFRDGELLFINIDPHDFGDPEFNVENLGVDDPRRVVIEITERTAIKDYPKFRERLRAFRERGFRFAVDDAGSGYAGLGSIANLEPDFIKLDISLINAIDTNFIKQNLVETMVRFANDHGARVIAEGVERAEEYKTVRDLGVHLVQGFYLHRPSARAEGGTPAAVARRCAAAARTAGRS
jgi:EAL domain-containing protein (putative c-di-GMP-specific phosphodiesterase class I)/GGDEF domain-containing protein